MDSHDPNTPPPADGQGQAPAGPTSEPNPLSPTADAQASSAGAEPLTAVGPSPVEAPIVVPGPRLDAPDGAATNPPKAPGHPSYVFLAVVALISLVADVGTKLWAERTLDGYPGYIEVWPDHIAFVLAKNKGGAWGLLQGTHENIRRPFFLLVSAAAIAFIVALYRKLQPHQRALKWGLPLVLGGALGNVYDRIRYGHVIDFIDFHMVWQGRDHHWPTFNVADIAICVGVALMAIDMFGARRGSRRSLTPPPPAPDAIDAPQAEARPVDAESREAGIDADAPMNDERPSLATASKPAE
jgi:lipoprotein signal peptidase